MKKTKAKELPLIRPLEIKFSGFEAQIPQAQAFPIRRPATARKSGRKEVAQLKDDNFIANAEKCSEVPRFRVEVKSTKQKARFHNIPIELQKPIEKNAKVILSKIRAHSPSPDSHADSDALEEYLEPEKAVDRVVLPPQVTVHTEHEFIGKLNEIRFYLMTNKTDFVSEEFYYSLMNQLKAIELLSSKDYKIS